MNVDLLRDLLVDAIVIPLPPHEKPGPRQCCGDFARVVRCSGTIDSWLCPVCNRQWEAPCR